MNTTTPSGPLERLVRRLREGRICMDGGMCPRDIVCADAADEIERLQLGIRKCYRMLLNEPDTRGALFKAEDILRELLLPPNAEFSGPHSGE